MRDLDQFIAEYVTKRPCSMFLGDIEANRAALTAKTSRYPPLRSPQQMSFKPSA